MLEHRGLGRQSGPDEAYPLPGDQPLFAELDGASVHGRVTGLGNWIDREGNANIEPKLLRAWLNKQGVSDALVARALHLFGKAAGDTSESLYDRNRAVCLLARMARSLLVIERLLLALLESGRTTASRAASSDTAKGAATRTRPWGG